MGFKGYTNPVVNRVLDELEGKTMSLLDWLDLAMACIDQAGMPIYAQTRVRKAIQQWWPAYGKGRE